MKTSEFSGSDCTFIDFSLIEPLLKQPLENIGYLAVYANASLYFRFDEQKRQEMFFNIYNIAQRQDFCLDVATLFARYHDYDLAVQYICEKLRIPDIGNKCDYLMYSRELHLRQTSLTDRLAYYYQQHEDITENLSVDSPSLLEVENRRFQLNMKNGVKPKLIVPEEILKVFKSVQIDEPRFAMRLGSTEQFGQKLVERIDKLRWLK
jgi:hypothetical protein